VLFRSDGHRLLAGVAECPEQGEVAFAEVGGSDGLERGLDRGLEIGGHFSEKLKVESVGNLKADGLFRLK